MDIPFWEFRGTTVVTSSYVRLTPDRQSKMGNLWNTTVCSHYTTLHTLLCFPSLPSRSVSTTGSYWSTSGCTDWAVICLETVLLSGTRNTRASLVRTCTAGTATGWVFYLVSLQVRYLEIWSISQVWAYSLTLTTTIMECIR